MCDKRRLSLKKTAERPPRPIQHVLPEPATHLAQQQPTRKLPETPHKHTVHTDSTGEGADETDFMKRLLQSGRSCVHTPLERSKVRILYCCIMCVLSLLCLGFEFWKPKIGISVYYKFI